MKKRLKINPAESDTIRGINPNEYEIIQTAFSIRINPNHFDFGFILINSNSKFGFDQSELELIRIDLD